ncbi:Uma2 family endonuclease [Oscillatoria sp. FACHB-1406]|uniref:Uma2 family endonuclease n=1 Tax=Oscillatoria sp. FACHB-1406 TaxID=2692846 RepID=UPI001687B851|nr:Uma2 family endonuclease [Oscillatoria sp. FACHB-1406]MBD2580525.1 Uma2 family endonuclease [Oscillatoria sp. FACHB-1406]
MVAQLPQTTASPIVYPDDDGLPMSDNTLQFEWIMTFYYNLDWLFADNPEVFVAGNLLWYPVEGQVKTRQAPDIMVVFGARKGYRGSYKQWQEKNIAPQVVFEILSPGNTQTEMNRKLIFYNLHGVEEYYIYDPHKNELSGLLRPQESETGDRHLQVIEEMQGWTSLRLGIRFELSEETLQVYRPDGQSFATYLEAQQQLEQAQRLAEAEAQRAEQAEAALAAEQRKAQLLAERLRQMGINPDEL